MIKDPATKKTKTTTKQKENEQKGIIGKTDMNTLMRPTKIPAEKRQA